MEVLGVYHLILNKIYIIIRVKYIVHKFFAEIWHMNKLTESQREKL